MVLQIGASSLHLLKEKWKVTCGDCFRDQLGLRFEPGQVVRPESSTRLLCQVRIQINCQDGSWEFRKRLNGARLEHSTLHLLTDTHATSFFSETSRRRISILQPPGEFIFLIKSELQRRKEFLPRRSHQCLSCRMAVGANDHGCLLDLFGVVGFYDVHDIKTPERGEAMLPVH